VHGFCTLTRRAGLCPRSGNFCRLHGVGMSRKIGESFVTQRVGEKQPTANASAGDTTPPRLPCRVGLLSTWNQECGLATYARYLFSQMPEDDLIVFSEEGAKTVKSDEAFVRRCWTKASSDRTQATHYSKLEAAVVRERTSSQCTCELLFISCVLGFSQIDAFQRN
jgi:hypothetical protein